jgi:5-methylcytosine-specific restriction enzyme A
MALHDLTAESVRAAVEEFDKLGRDKFLKNYGFRPAKSYYLKIGEQVYDSKAIAGVAHKFARPSDGVLRRFSGGERTVMPRLQKLGFIVVNKDVRNPDWTRDELILALDFYFRHRARIPDKTSKPVLDLSRELNSLARALNLGGGVTFRNANGVYMKLMNFRRLDPDYTASGGVGLSRGGRADAQVWNDFSGDLPKLRATAELIRKGIAAGDAKPAEEDDGGPEPEIAEAPEGRVVTRMHRSRERNGEIVGNKKASVLKKHGRLQCEGCNFDFEHFYGERGRGFAECHHVNPVSTLAPGQRTRLDDLAIVCANCHRMIHAKAPWLAMDELRAIVRRGAQPK